MASADAYLRLADGSLHTLGAGAPAGLFVRGRRTADGFLPLGDVEGEGAFGGAGHPGWMELADGSFHGNETGRVPARPYVEGVLGEDGIFRPQSRAVVHGSREERR